MTIRNSFDILQQGYYGLHALSDQTNSMASSWNAFDKVYCNNSIDFSNLAGNINNYSWDNFSFNTMSMTNPKTRSSGINWGSTNFWNNGMNNNTRSSWGLGMSWRGFDSFSFSSNSNSNSGSGSYVIGNNKTGPLLTQLVSNAKSYLGKINSDAAGNRAFSPGGRRQAWCADFVTYVTKQTFGSRLPKSFGSSSVYYLREWGKKNNCYRAMPSSNKAEFIAKNIKAGDIMIEKRGGKSHTGIVTKVNADGSFETVEGNTSNKVGARKYTAYSGTLSGFVSLSNYV